MFRSGGSNRGLMPPAPGPEAGDAGLSQPSLYAAGAAGSGSEGPWGGRLRRRHVLGACVLAVVLVFAGGVAAVLAVRASLAASSTALVQLSGPLGGGTIVRVTAVTGPHDRRVAVAVRGHQIWPKGILPVGERVSVHAVVKRPGWVSWLTGSTEDVSLTLQTPSSHLREHYLTLAPGAPLRLQFAPAVAVLWTGQQGRLRRRVLPSPQHDVTVPRSGSAGSLLVAAAPRTWERAQPSAVSWFPPGARAAAVANPAPGSQIQPATPITLTFSEPVSRVLGGAAPALSPATAGRWSRTGSHTLVFHPSGYGYGLDTRVTVALPNGVRLVGSSSAGATNTASWTVPRGTTLRLQQLLAQLGYLPLRFRESSGTVPRQTQAQEAAAVEPPAGSFSWRYGDTPAALRALWQPGSAGELTRGAVMAFENQHEMTADGEAGEAVWRALISDAVAHRQNSFGYTFVNVSESSETLNLWHDGHTVLTTPVNTGIAGAPTETGTFAVYEHIPSGTMSGTNPDGTKYKDPGIPWISYFNGGDALHGFIRASYGFPQSLGCVEMEPATAGKVYPYTPIGTIVHIT